MLIEYIRRCGYYDDNNMLETPRRAAHAFCEMIRPWEEVRETIAGILGKRFPADTDQMVMAIGCKVVSLCPHHLLPVVYNVDMAYIPNAGEGYLGISKLFRLAKALGKVPWLQEKFTTEVTRYLHEVINSQGAAIRVVGWHSCASLRGVRSDGSYIITQNVTGVFRDNPSTKQEFFGNLPAPKVAM